MAHKNKQHPVRYLVLSSACLLYALCLLVAPLFNHDIGWVWVFYGVIPTTLAISLSLRDYYRSMHFAQHSDHYLHQIFREMQDVKAYVATMAGVNEEFDQ